MNDIKQFQTELTKHRWSEDPRAEYQLYKTARDSGKEFQQAFNTAYSQQFTREFAVKGCIKPFGV